MEIEMRWEIESFFYRKIDFLRLWDSFFMLLESHAIVLEMPSRRRYGVDEGKRSTSSFHRDVDGECQEDKYCLCAGVKFYPLSGSAASYEKFHGKNENRYKIYLLEFHRSENPARVKVNFRYLFLLSNLHRWSDTKILYFNFVEMIVSWFESKWLCGLLCSVKEKCCGLSYRSRKSSFPNSSSCNLIQFISASNDVILSAFALPFASTNLRISNI